MKFKIYKKDLLNSLKIVSSITSKVSNERFLNSFLLESKKESLIIRCTNMEVSYENIIDNIEVEEEGKACVNAQDFFVIINEVEENTVINIEKKKNKWVNLTFKETNAEIPCLEENKYPHIKFIESEKEVEIDIKETLTFINRSIPFITEERSRANIKGLNLKIKSDGNKILWTSTDSFKLCVFYGNIINKKKDISIDIDVTIPKISLNNIIKFIEDKEGVVNVSFDDKFIKFSKEKEVIEITLLDKSFPKLIQMIENYKPIGNFIIKRKEFLSKLRIMNIIGIDRISKEGFTNFFVKKEGITIESDKKSERGFVRDSIKCKVDIEEKEFAINTLFIIKALEAVSKKENEDEDVKFYFDENNFILLVNEGYEKVKIILTVVID